MPRPTGWATVRTRPPSPGQPPHADASPPFLDLGLRDDQYNLVVSIFFVLFVVFAPPLAMLSKRLGPARALPVMMVAFGSMTLATAATQSFSALMAVRWLLGMAEAAFFPTVVFYLTTFYRRGELARRLQPGQRLQRPARLWRLPYPLAPPGLALPVPHRGRRHPPLRRLRLLVPAPERGRGPLPRRRAAPPRPAPHPNRLFVRRRPGLWPSRLPRRLRSPDDARLPRH